MHKIYSKVNPEKLLHMVFRKRNMTTGRQELIPGNNFIQCSALNMEAGKTFRPHYHLWKEGEEKVIAQESWVVIQGQVAVYFYDTDGHLICSETLHPGDVSFTLEGGHTYTILEEGTLVYEYKTGPYKGQKLDKEFIKDDEREWKGC